MQRYLIPILNDTIAESNETFMVFLNNLSGGGQLAASASASVTITDSDERVKLEHARYVVSEAAGFVRIGVARGENARAATVQIETSDTIAVSGADYVGLTNTLEFAAGEQLKLVDVGILNDGLTEARETFRVVLRSVTGGAVLVSPLAATVSIEDNDPGVSLEQGKLWVRETDGEITVKVLRANDGVLSPFTVGYWTIDGTAAASADYVAVSGTLAFGQGEVLKRLTIQIAPDEVVEIDETFPLVIGGVTGNATLGNQTNALITVLDTTGTRAYGFSSVIVRPDRIILEGYFQNAVDLLNMGLSKPSLSIYTSPIGLPDGIEFYLFNHPLTRNSIWFQISSISHVQAGDYYWFFGTGASIREAMRSMRAFTLWFLNTHLKGITAPMPVLSDFPRVVNFRQK